MNPKPKSLTREERETGILWNDADDICIVWTCSPLWLRKLTRRLGEPTQIDPNGSWSWTVPKSRITVRGKPRKSRQKPILPPEVPF